MESVVAYTTEPASSGAGRELGERIMSGLPGDPPDVVIVFASPRYAHEKLLLALQASCCPRLLILISIRPGKWRMWLRFFGKLR